MKIDIFALYEDLKKYVDIDYDDLFYDAPEGNAQLCILQEMLDSIINKLEG